MPAKTTNALIGVLLSAVVLLFAFTVPITFSWFANNNTVTGSGANVSARSGLLEIRAVKDGADIGVSAIAADTVRIGVDSTTDDRSGLIRPGTAGSFTFYVRDPAAETYTFQLDLTVSNDAFADPNNAGFCAGVKEERKEEALRYVNAHIMFFTGKSEDNRLTGWINPSKGYSEDVSSPGKAPHPVTIYWIWVPWYNDIFSADSTLIAEKDRQEIATYYLLDADAAHRSELFSGGSADEQGYNEADYIIGITLKYICFDLKVQGR